MVEDNCVHFAQLFYPEMHSRMIKEANASQIIPRAFEATRAVLKRRSQSSMMSFRSQLSHEDPDLYDDLVLLERSEQPAEGNEEDGLDAAESSDDGM